MNVQRRLFESLAVEVYADKEALGRAAAAHLRPLLQSAIGRRGHANMILAAANSQLTFYAALRCLSGIDWAKVNLLHMDEYVGIAADHPASFRNYLRQEIVDAVRPAAFHAIQGDASDIQQECLRYAELLREYPADVCCLGFGENGHLAFNDPPEARFDDPALVKVVKLEQASRQQQVGEGHFPLLAAVPEYAITLTIPALLAADHILAIVPEKRKAAAVKAALTGPISAQLPASILRSVSKAVLFLDSESYAQVTK